MDGARSLDRSIAERGSQSVSIRKRSSAAAPGFVRAIARNIFLLGGVFALAIAARTAHAAPPYTFYVLAPEHLSADLTVTSLEPGNTISVGSFQRTLTAYESAVVPATALFPGRLISGTGRYTVGSDANAADLLAPDFLAGTQFVIPHVAGSHKYYVQATTSAANLTINLGATSSNLSIAPGTAYEIDAGSDNTISGRITSDQPIVVAHVAYASGTAQDAYPVPPASLEVLGIRSQNAVIGAFADGTSVEVYATDGSATVYALDAGQKVVVNIGSNAAQGAGSAVRVLANQPVAAVQYDDSDGADATAFWPVSAFTRRYAFPVNAQYVAVACLAPDVTVTLFKGSTGTETQTCSASGSNPGKLFFGATTSGNNVAAGWHLTASAPVYVMYEAATPQDEHNLSGVQSSSGPAAPALAAVSTPTTSNPIAVTGTADAGAVVRLYVNGKLQQVQAATGGGTFSFNTELFDGNNVIHAVTVSGGNESTPSNVVEVVYSNTLPRTQSGSISGNVVWTPGNPATPYVVSSTLTVAAGATLVLQPGTTLRFANSTSLTINGALKIAGTAQSPVVLTSNAASPTRGNWAGVVLNASATGSEIAYATIDWAATGVKVNGAAVTIRDSTIRNFPTGAGTGVWITGAASGTQVINNAIRGVGDTGRCIAIEDASPAILRNTLSDCDRGIVTYRAASPTVTGNTITSNDYGISVEGLGFTPMPIVNGNSIYGNDNASIVTATYATGAQDLKLNARNNWWGTTNFATISASIGDWTDTPGSTTLPSVDFGSPLNAADGAPIAGNYLIGPLQATSTTLSAGETHHVIGTLQIPSGRSLTISAGVRVNFYAFGSTLLVDGSLTVQGVEGNIAQIVSGRPAPGRTDWAGIQIRAGGSALIEYALVESASTAIRSMGVPITVRYSTIRSFTSGTGSGIWITGSGASGSQIIGNVIRGVSDGGRCIFAEDSSPTITNNVVSDCDSGILVYRASSPLITGNTITSNDNGIVVDGAGVTSSPVATGNEISGNDNWNYAAANFAAGAQNLRLNATGNWWGTTNLTTIGDLISDWTDAPTSTTTPVVDIGGLLDAAGGTPISANYLNGPLAAATTTLTAGATYQVTGALQVPSGKSLTIPAGTRVNFHTSNSTLLVDGTLVMEGSAENPVVMTSGRVSPGRNDWAGVQIRAGSSSLIEYALIEWASSGVRITGVPATIRYSTIRNFANNSNAGIRVTGAGASATQIVGNVIRGVNDEGHCVFAEDSSPTITNNTLSDCDRGVTVYRASSPVITGNTITSNDNGIIADGAGATPQPVATGNQILGNDLLEYGATTTYAAGAQSVRLNATGNWWGSTDPSAISLKISDFTDSPTSTTVPLIDFSGFLDSAAGAPVPGNQLIGPLSASLTLSSGTQYEVLGALTVPSGRSLTIPNGTILRFHMAASLIVEGALQIQGTEAAPVRLTSGRATPARGDWFGVIVRSTANAVNIDGAEIEWAVRGVEVQSAIVTVQNSAINYFTTAGIAMTSSGSASQILDNEISNGNRTGDGIWLTSSSPTIQGNRITGTNRAVYMTGASKPLVSSNVLTDNNWGLYLFGNNSVSANDVPVPTIQGNDIFANATAQLELNAYPASNPAFINAIGNWWGTPDPVTGREIKLSAGSVAAAIDFSDAASTSINFDSRPPVAPAQLNARAVSNSEIVLSWVNAGDDFGVALYLVERCAGTSCSDFAQVGTSASTGYADGGLTTDTVYSYRVRAQDAASLLSAYSAVASAVARSDTEAPSRPTAPIALVMSSTQIDLEWTASTDNIGVTGYIIERCQGAGCSNFSEVTTVATRTHRNTGLSAASTYRYRIRARDAAGNPSTYSDVVTATTSINGADCD